MYKKTLSLNFISPNFIKNLLPQSLAFTMAEILISLTIIGVIAAITLPSLRANINEKAWATQRKALYSRMSQAISMLPSLNGYGVVMNENGTINYASTNQKAAMAFVTEGLNKVLKINNICDSTNLSKCGIPVKITNMANNKLNFPTDLVKLNPAFSAASNPQKNINTNTAAFETKNGESIAVFYNPLCQTDMKETVSYYGQTKMCANFVYDLNGNKGPNKVGKDIGFITALYATDSVVVAPVPVTGARAVFLSKLGSVCRTKNSDTKAANIQELMALVYNNPLLRNATGAIQSATKVSATQNWVINLYTGSVFLQDNINYTSWLECVKR